MGCSASNPQGYSQSDSRKGAHSKCSEEEELWNILGSPLKSTPFDETYALQSVLGEGAFAQVRSVRHRKTQRELAVKILNLGRTSPKGVEKGVVKFHHERSLWARLSEKEHPNLVRLHDAFQETSYGYLVMDICSSSMFDGLKAERTLDEHVLVRYFRDMLCGLQRLHQLRIVHRDVKQDNMLMSGPHGKTVKLCDFGLSACLPKDGGKLRGIYGTAPYLPPEMLQPKGTHGTSMDI
jgi:serine/threonine protein kinase